MKYDIPVNFTVDTNSENIAEEVITQFLRDAKRLLDSPEIVDWEFVEFIPDEDLHRSCCC